MAGEALSFLHRLSRLLPQNLSFFVSFRSSSFQSSPLLLSLASFFLTRSSRLKPFPSSFSFSFAASPKSSLSYSAASFSYPLQICSRCSLFFVPPLQPSRILSSSALCQNPTLPLRLSPSFLFIPGTPLLNP